MEEIYDETISDSEIDDILGIENDPVKGDVAEDEVDQPEDGDNPDKSEAAKEVSFKKKVKKKGKPQLDEESTYSKDSEYVAYEEFCAEKIQTYERSEAPIEEKRNREDESYDHKAPVPESKESSDIRRDVIRKFDEEGAPKPVSSLPPKIVFTTDHAHKDFREQIGDIAVGSVKPEGDSTLDEGLREMKRSEVLQISRALLQDTGIASVYKDIRRSDERLKRACQETDNLLSEGKLKRSDLEDAAVLKEKLSDAGVIKTSALEIEKWREDILTKYKLKSALLSKKKLLSKAEAEFVKSDRFYKSASAPAFGRILDKYLRDEKIEIPKNVKISLLRKEDIAHLSKKLEKSPYFKEIHKEFLKDYEKRLNRRKLRFTVYGRGAAPQKPLRLGAHIAGIALSQDGTMNSPYHKAMSYLTSADIARRAFLLSGSYVKKQFKKSYIGRVTGKAADLTKKKIVSTLSKSRVVKLYDTAKSTVTFTAKHTVRYARVKASHALGFDKVREGIKKVGHTAFNTKPVRFTRKLAKKATVKAKAAKTTYLKVAHIISTPRRAIGAITAFIRKVNLKILGIIGGALLTLFKLYNILLAVVMLLLSIDSALVSASDISGQMVKDYIEMARSVINYEDYADLKSDIAYMKERDKERYERARLIGESEPKDPYVTCNEKIDSYGSPQNRKGYTITVTDPYGNELPYDASNARDIEALCVAMISNDLGMYKGYARDKRMFDELIADMYDLLACDIEVEEGDIYFCDRGCRVFYYHCNELGDYEQYYDIYRGGGKCYTQLIPLKDEDYGCRTRSEYDHILHRYESTYYCPGEHTARVCFGHKDAEIFIKLYGLEHAIANNIYPRDWRRKSYAPMIKEFVERGAWNNEVFAGYARRYFGGDWSSLYGVDLTGGVGFSSIDPIPASRIEEILSTLPDDLDENRRKIIEFALKSVGYVPYQWGGKATGSGWSARFGSSVADDKGRSNGLDCSGFVQWVYRSSINKSVPGSTAGFSGYDRVAKDELSVGDLGFYRLPGSEENHIGIYAGTDEFGNDTWVHCAGSTGATYGSGNFKYFVKLID